MRKLRTRTASSRTTNRGRVRLRGYSKYHAKRTEVDGIVFASRAEARRYVELKALEAGGLIRNLRLQVKFELHVGDIKIGSYIADFVYYDGLGFRVVEDVKGFKTPLYRWKKKHVAAEHRIDISEV